MKSGFCFKYRLPFERPNHELLERPKIQPNDEIQKKEKEENKNNKTKTRQESNAIIRDKVLFVI